MRRRSALVVLVAVPLVLVGFVITGLLRPDGDPGMTEEVLHDWVGDLPVFTDVTQRLGLGNWQAETDNQIAGGVTLADLNADGRLDIIVTAGPLAVFLSAGEQYVAVGGDGPAQTSSSAVADLDADGHLDLVIGRSSGADVIIWGGSWVESREFSAAATTELAGGLPTTGMLVADLAGDEALDIVRLGYGRSRAVADVIWENIGQRQFGVIELPNSHRKSLAGEIGDVDLDGSLDVWVTRDVGWDEGADSVYTLRAGEWVDIAPSIGVDLAIDGMGVTLADLNGDGRLDAYLSDLGDNEVLRADGPGFLPFLGTGSARIRPVGADADVISSSWSTGAADLNLDGVLDLVVANGGFPTSAVPNKIPGTLVELDDPPALFLGIGDGTYADVWPMLGLPWTGASRGMALGDLDADGDTDLVVVAIDGGLTVLRNDVGADSVTVTPDEGCDPHGARVMVEQGDRTYAALLTPHGFAGAHAPQVIVGTDTIDVRVVVDWPNGTRTETVVPGEAGRRTVQVGC